MGGGLATLLVLTLHGALFVTLKTNGELRDRASRLIRVLGLAALAVGGIFLLATQLTVGKPVTWITAAVAAAGLAGAVVATLRGRDGWAFTANAAAIVAVTVTLFVSLWLNVMPALEPASSLTVDNAASTPYTLTVMTWVAAIFTPVVLVYQGWTSWVFRRRLTRPAAGR